MKKTIKLAVVAALALGATSAFATNGTNLIGYGAKSRAMGGTGIATFHGAETAFANPALITKSEKSTEITIGATLLMPSVSFEAKPYGVSESKSKAGSGMIPSVAAINKSDNFAWGIALYGVGGMGVDYREETNMLGAAQQNINDNLMLMRMSVPLAYEFSGASVAIAPVIEYGALSMTSGATTDIAMGFEIGAAYEIAGVSLGFDYKSAVTHDFKNTFMSTNPKTGATQTKLDTPAVLGLGLSYKMGASTIALDYKSIAYSSALGFEDFEWKDQSVIAIGYEYATSGWAARAGFNHGKSPLPNDKVTNAGASTTAGSMMLFPAVAESHITLGGSYNANESISIDLAYMLATGSQTADLAADSGGAGTPVGEATATNNQNSFSVALNYTF